MGEPSRSSPLSPVSTPCTAPPCSSSFAAVVSLRSMTPAASAFSPSQRAISATDALKKPWFRIVGGVGIRTAFDGVR